MLTRSLDMDVGQAYAKWWKRSPETEDVDGLGAKYVERFPNEAGHELSPWARVKAQFSKAE